MKLFLLLLSVLCIIGYTICSEKSHKFKDGESITIWTNKVGPYHNPHETYLYHTLPFCDRKQGKTAKQHMEGLGEALQGYELRDSGLEIKFREKKGETVFCTLNLNEDTAKVFRKAIKNQYMYELFVDDLPVWGMVGDFNEKEDPELVYIYTHQEFVFKTNGNRLISVDLTPGKLKPVVPDQELTFTYSAEWEDTTIDFESRYDKYLDNTFFEHQIHWFSIFNSFMMVVFLVGLVSMILMRTLKKDFARLTRDEDDESGLEVGDESGWKQVQGDVFRPPPRLLLFSVLFGTGIQIVALVALVVGLAIIFYESHFIFKRGSLVSVFIGCYAFTALLAGYVSGSHYSQYSGKNWIKCMILTSSMFPCFVFSVAFVLDVVAMSYASLASIPLETIIVVLGIWIFFSVPLTFVGTLIGRNFSGQSKFPCRVAPVPRPIPEKQWYQEPLTHIILGGVLPFGSIFIEMYFVFTAFWQYKYYYVFGFLLLVFLILIIVSVCVTIVSTYFLLNSEDYRWHWISFLSSASTAGYVFLYAVYYFVMKTSMTGVLQTVFYFGYTFMFCAGLGAMTGSIGYLGTSIFVRKIFSEKIE